MEKDLTHGNTLKLIISFCIPLIGAIFQQLYNVVDTMIVDVFGVDALAASRINRFFKLSNYWFCFRTCHGFGIPIAQAFVLEKKKNASKPL